MTSLFDAVLEQHPVPDRPIRCPGKGCTNMVTSSLRTRCDTCPPPPMACADCGYTTDRLADLARHYRQVDGEPSECDTRMAGAKP